MIACEKAGVVDACKREMYCSRSLHLVIHLIQVIGKGNIYTLYSTRSLDYTVRCFHEG